jgi:anaerobic selenocysteine-containing dehydrogenase
MNEQPLRKTFFGGCPHDCPDTCAMIYEVEDGKLIEVRGNRDHPMTRGTLCVKLKDYHDHHYNPDRAHRLGRGDRRDYDALEDDYRRAWKPGDHALFLSRQ